MSSPSTTFRMFYPDTNTVTNAAFFAPDGSALTPQTMADGTGDPAGFKSKVITFASPSEPLFVTPVFATPESPVSLYLCRDDAGTFKKVLDESTFNASAPGRPTPKNDVSQYLLYTATDLGGGVKTYSVKAPVSPVVIVKSKGKDPVTGEKLDGNNILLRWTGTVPTLAEVEADIEDIADPRGFVPYPFSNITTYAESSVGLSLLSSDTQIVEQDGMGHMVNFRVRYNVNGDVSAWVSPSSQAFIQYALPAPNPPATFAVTLLRDRVDTIPDVVKAEWTKDLVSPGTGIEIFATDYLGKKHSLYTSNGNETEARLENVSRFIVQETGPAVPRPYVFSIVATNISAKSSEKTAASLNITSKVKPVVPPTPDEIAGTAEDVNYASLKATVYANVLSQMGTLPEEGQAIVYAAIDKMVLKIKDVVRLGGSVTLDDFGSVEAKWTNERMARNPSTGEPVVVPPYRGVGFTPSIGFKTGTRNGTIMTDLQAKPPTP